MKQMSLIEMDGFLKGKCIPSDLKVNETNAEYLVRKFAELEARCAALAAENATDDERIIAIEGIHNCEQCGDEGIVVGEMGITRCACGQAGNSPATPGGWISCSEQMPEMGERQCYVLAADFKNNYPPNIPNTQVGVYGDWFNDGNPTWDDGDGEDLYLKEVTHWMPLPEPPQEVNRG